MQEFPQKPVNQQHLWVQNVFHISRFSSCEKSSVSTCFHSSRKSSLWNILWGSRCKSWCGHSAARHCPTPGQCPTQHTANWARCHPLGMWLPTGSAEVAINPPVPGCVFGMRIKPISNLGTLFYFLPGNLQWTPWSHFEFLAELKQEKGTNAEKQELRFTTNLLTSDPNRKQATNLFLPTVCIYRLVHRGDHFSFPFKKPHLGDKEQKRY